MEVVNRGCARGCDLKWRALLGGTRDAFCDPGGIEAISRLVDERRSDTTGIPVKKPQDPEGIPAIGETITLWRREWPTHTTRCQLADCGRTADDDGFGLPQSRLTLDRQMQSLECLGGQAATHCGVVLL